MAKKGRWALIFRTALNLRFRFCFGDILCSNRRQKKKKKKRISSLGRKNNIFDIGHCVYSPGENNVNSLIQFADKATRLYVTDRKDKFPHHSPFASVVLSGVRQQQTTLITLGGGEGRERSLVCFCHRCFCGINTWVSTILWESEPIYKRNFNKKYHLYRRVFATDRIPPLPPPTYLKPEKQQR